MKETTTAAVLEQTNQPLRVMELELPELAPGQVLVEVAYSGVCHTQLGEVRGKRGPDPYLPHTLGHEGSGTVLRAGPGVNKVKPGDRVVLSWIKGSGAVVSSTMYQSSSGPVNSGAISTFMRRTITCEACVTPVPPDMPLREAALLGCAVPTGCGIVLNTAGIRPKESLAIFGMGGIGISAVLGAVIAGAAPIAAIDINEEKLRKAAELGATHTINASINDPLTVLSSITGGRGVDFAIEAAGRPEVMELAFKAVKAPGGLCVIAGNVEPGQMIRLDPYSLIRGKKIIGTWGGESVMDKDIPFYVKSFKEGRLALEKLISKEYQLAAINELIADLESGRIVRGVVNMSL